MQLTYITTRKHLEEYCAELAVRDIPEFGLHLRIEDGVRTPLQNSAMHLYFRQLAEALNDAGYDMKRVINVDIPWTEESVKKWLWGTLMQAMYDKKHTAKLSTAEVGKVYEALARLMSEKFSISVPFPVDEMPMI